jgi:aconitate hydratase
MEDTEMITLHDGPITLTGGVPKDGAVQPGLGTLAYTILDAHNRSNRPGTYRIRFDRLISHDITYVGIIQTARASGMKEFPLPYTMTNCHNSLCAVGGTINEDDHAFGLSAAKRYGGVYVPANQAVIHQYAREMLSRGGDMILGSDSHTRYGPLGVMGIGEGGPELVKQLLSNTYDINAPEVVLVYLVNEPRRGVGPHDVAIALCAAVYDKGFVKNKILEFAGPGVAGLDMDFRFGIDVMTTETAGLSSIWETDDAVREYYKEHGREGDFRKLSPPEGAAYHSMITIDLAKIEPMIALPFHPAKGYPIRELNRNAGDILRTVERDAADQFGAKAKLNLTDKVRKGRVLTDQGIIAGCAGGLYDNIREAAAILEGASIGADYFSLSLYPSSMPVNIQLIEGGIQQKLLEAGALFKPCFCGPCFGAGDVPGNNGFSIRHVTRNFPNREGSQPGAGQLSAVALMDARSIAATAKAQGLLTAADELDYDPPQEPVPPFRAKVYENRVYQGFGKPEPAEPLRFGPNIADWPRIDPLGEHLLLRLAAVIHDPVTTTDELIPSGETSSYRSNPLKLASFTLARRDPQYVSRAQGIREMEEARQGGKISDELAETLAKLGVSKEKSTPQICSALFAMKPGDGSAREQAASCQRVLGGGANICYEYATKRYRSNLINWGLLPFTLETGESFEARPGDWVYIPDIRAKIASGEERFPAKLLRGDEVTAITLHIGTLTSEEREIILAGCLMNYYRQKKEQDDD